MISANIQCLYMIKFLSYFHLDFLGSNPFCSCDKTALMQGPPLVAMCTCSQSDILAKI